MKRVRNSKTIGFGFFPVAEVTKEIKRQRKPKEKEDPFIARHKGKSASVILLDFLKARRKYVQKNYTKQTQVVLMELDLYEDIVLRLTKSKVLL